MKHLILYFILGIISSEYVTSESRDNFIDVQMTWFEIEECFELVAKHHLKNEPYKKLALDRIASLLDDNLQVWILESNTTLDKEQVLGNISEILAPAYVEGVHLSGACRLLKYEADCNDVYAHSYLTIRCQQIYMATKDTMKIRTFDQTYRFNYACYRWNLFGLVVR